MSKVQLTAMWEQNEKTVYAQAWDWAAKTGKPVDDFIGEGHAVFMRCVKRFDEGKKCGFNWFFHGALRNAFISLALKQDVPGHGTADMEQTILEGDEGETVRVPFVTPDPSFHLRLTDWLASLSNEAATVIRLLLDSPTEMMGIVGSDMPKMMSGKVTKTMREKLGWTQALTWRTHHEIQRRLGDL